MTWLSGHGFEQPKCRLAHTGSSKIRKQPMDTGAEVTAISMDTYRHLKKPQLTTASKVLYGPSRIKLKVKGMLVASISREDVTTKQPIFVVDGICFESCGQVRCHCQRTKRHPSYGDIIQKYPSVFLGLGNLGEEYEIKLKDGAKLLPD